MKKVTLFVLSLGLMFGAFAQRTLDRNAEKAAFLENTIHQVAFTPAKTAVKAGSLTISDVTTEEKEGSFHAIFTIDMGDANKYFATIYGANAVENYVASEDNDYTSVADYFAALIANYRQSYSDDQIFYTEGGETEFQGMYGNSAYEVYVYAEYEDGSYDVATKTFETPSSELSGTPAINSITPNCDATAGTIDWQLSMSNVREFYFHCIDLPHLESVFGDYYDQYPVDQLAEAELANYVENGYSSYFIYADEEELNYYEGSQDVFGNAWVNGEEYVAVALPINGNGDQGEWASVTFTFGQGVGLNDVAQMMVSVYPNPASDYLTVNSDKINKVELYNELGQVVYSSAAHNGMNISLAGFAAGTYVVKAFADGATATSKVVVK